jgi:hypothetical protein
MRLVAILFLSTLVTSLVQAGSPKSLKAEQTSLKSLNDFHQLRSPFELAPLPYAYDALKEVIDAKTMRIHHTKHHQAYVDNLNRALDEKNKQSLLEILAQISSVNEAVRKTAVVIGTTAFFGRS